MSRFLQLHALTFYPPANLNRDDTGRPKTATVGGVPRLRISSQALKRAWRTSWRMQESLSANIGDRTQRIGRDIANLARRDFGFSEPEAAAIGRLTAAVFGKLENAPKQGQEYFTRQLTFISPDERSKLSSLLERLASDQEERSRLTKMAEEFGLDGSDKDEDAGEGASKKSGKKKQSKATTKYIKEIQAEILTLADSALDIAMFGRMLADAPKFNREAAVQVAHAITTHKVTVEDDYYTAVDDLKTAEEDAGAGFVGELGFGSGVFYLYACVDTTLLAKNLGGDTGLAATACAALAEAVATISPRGKQPSFAARARAHYVLAERGDVQPRTLAGAFVKPVTGDNLAQTSIVALQTWRDRIDQCYGPAAAAASEVDVAAGTGTLAELTQFCREAARNA